MNKKSLLLCGGIIAFAGSASAQQSQAPASPAQTQQRLQRPSDSFGQPSAAAVSSVAAQSSASMRLSQIMGSAVQSTAGKPLGTVRDITVDPQTGRLEFAILSLTGTNGLPSSLTETRTPSSAARATAEIPGASSGTAVNDTARATAPQSGVTTPGTAALPGTVSPAKPEGALSGNEAGIANTQTGDLASGKLVAVPWQLFSRSMSSKVGGNSTASSTVGTGTAYLGITTLVLNVDENALRMAPAFDYTSWNRLDQADFSRNIHSHFGLNQNEPESAVGSPGLNSIRGTGTGKSNEPSDRSTPSQNIKP